MASYNNIFQITNNDVVPNKGCILIAEPLLSEAYFQRSVVLLVDHTANGSMGFVLNKRTDLYVNTFFKELNGMPKIPIYFGGPVGPNRLYFVHTLGDVLIPDAMKINDNLYFDGDFDSLVRYIKNGHSIEGKVRFFLGYSGWDKGQLMSEIDQHSWVVSNNNSFNLLLAEGEKFWKESVRQLGRAFKAWNIFPKDPSLN